MLDNFKDVLTVDDLCVIFHIGKNSAYKLLQNHTIPNRRIGKKYVIPKKAVEKYLSYIGLLTNRLLHYLKYTAKPQ